MIISLLLFILASGCQGDKVAENQIYTGTIEANTYTVSAEISGKIQEITSKQGDTVKDGDTLMSIDIQVYDLQKKQAMGALKMVKAKEESLPNSASDSLKNEAQGAVEQAQAAVDLAQLQVDKGNIKTIMDGTITEIFVQKGESVNPGTRVVEISDLHNVYVKIYVEESKRDKIKLDDTLTVTLNNKELSGKVIYLSPKSEFTPKNVETKDEKAKTLFEVKLQLPDNITGSVGSMVDIIID